MKDGVGKVSNERTLCCRMGPSYIHGEEFRHKPGSQRSLPEKLLFIGLSGKAASKHSPTFVLDAPNSVHCSSILWKIEGNKPFWPKENTGDSIKSRKALVPFLP